MKITMYELLGLVKDGKAPELIEYDDMIWEYDGDYYSSKNNIILEEYCNLITSLNDTIEILEEEKKIPEKLSTKTPFDDKEKEVFILENRVKINEIIDYLDYLKSKGDE